MRKSGGIPRRTAAIRALVVLWCFVAFLFTPGFSLALAPQTPHHVVPLPLATTHLPHARAASGASEHAFAGEVAQPQATSYDPDVLATHHASPRIARVGATSQQLAVIAKQVAPRVTQFLWDGDELAAELDSETGPRGHVHYPGTFVPLLQIERGQILVVVTDHVGTPRDLVGNDGTVRWSAAYTAWGKIQEEYVAGTQAPRGPPGTADTSEHFRSPFRLMGQYFDEETGLSATRFRMWEAETGRWLSPDPLGLIGGKNLLGFDGCPTADWDPLGLISCNAKRATEIAAQMQKERTDLFQLGMCDECAAELDKRLQAEGISGQVVRLNVDRGTFGNLRTGQNLTPVTAGGGTHHTWIDVDGIAFDNVTPQGAPRSTFLSDLQVFPGANPTFTTTPF